MCSSDLNAVKNVAIQDKRISNASMEFDPDTGRPSFRLIQGVPGRSRAIEIAAMIGLPRHIIESARSRLGDQHGAVDRLLSELQKQMGMVTEERERLAAHNADLERNLAEVREKTEELERERRTLAKGMREKLDRTEREVRQKLEEELRRLRAIDRKERDRVQPRELISSVIQPIEQFSSAEKPHRQVRTGDRVEHRSLKINGIVSSVDGTRAMLAAGGKRIQVEVADLFPMEEARGREGEGARGRREEQRLEEPAVGAELNLIGHRVEEALDESDKFIDRSLMDGKAAVRLIHGFGTGALRKALREYLKTHPGVKSFRPGSEKEGGDGATVAILDV